MSKSRFTTTDVQAMVRDIRAKVMGQRLANVYDLSEKCYLFKFAIPGKSEKVTIVVESGVRFHTTKYARDMPELPSAFAMKLRKFVRTKHLEDVRQIGIDRVVDFKFGSGDAVNHIILELYANGNIVLTDGNYEVLALLRSHQFEEDVSLQVGELYPIGYSTNAGATSSVRVDPDLSDLALADNAVNACSATSSRVGTMSFADFKEWATQKLSEHKEFHAHEELAHAAAVAARLAAAEAEQTRLAETEAAGDGTIESAKRTKATLQRKPKQPQAPPQSGPKRKKARELMLKQLLLSKDSGVASCGPEVLDHCLLRAGLRPNLRVEQFLTDLSEEAFSSMQSELAQAGAIMQQLDSQGMPGYIIIKPQQESDKTIVDGTAAAATEDGCVESSHSGPEYIEFLPMLFAQHADKPHLTFPSFDEAVDEYFCKIEGQRLEKEAQAVELAAQRKIEKVQRDQQKMLRGLAAQAERMQRGAGLLETYAEEVDKVALVINSALGAGMTWEDIDEMVKAETAAGNPIASLISRLNLQRNRVFLKLRDMDETSTGSATALVDLCEDSDSGAEDEKGNGKEGEQVGARAAGPSTSSARGAGQVVEVEFDLTLSAFANARKMYAQRKVALEKEARTLEASTRALQHVGERALQGVENQKLKRNLRAMRKVHWFEKFNWCISSEGYLILSGRDAQQNEILFKRYMRPGDIYVHADIGGAASCIVRAKSPAMQAAGVGAAAALAGGTLGGGGAVKLPERPISPLAIQEAGVMAVSRSSAWKGKIGGVAAWWVWASQVSKSAPSGEFLSAGSFMIYGKKNFLPPMALEMGFGVLFRLDDASAARHLKDWKDRSYLSDDRSMSQFTEVLDRYEVDFSELGPNALSLGDSGDAQDEVEGDRPSQLQSSSRSGTLVEHSGHAAQAGKTSVGTCPKSAAGKPEKVSNSQLKKEKREARKKGALAMKSAAAEPVLAPLVEENEEGEASDGSEQGTESCEEDKIYNKLKAGGGGAAKGNKKGAAADDESAVGGGKKKHLSKKKARRYAEQDEEDKELAMMVLGHSSAKTGERLGDKQTKAMQEKKTLDLKVRQEKAGIGLVKEESWDALLALLPEGVRAVLEGIISSGFLKAGEIDAYEMKALAALPAERGVEILYLFSEGTNLKKAGNKSAFLAGIMRRQSATAPKPVIAAPEVAVAAKKEEEEVDDPTDQSEQAMSRRALKRQEQADIQAIIDEEGIAEEEEGQQADEVEKLTGMPLPEDVLLYAVPVCGPYASMQNVRYKVKLTPGLGKKGKVCKQAVELFTRAKECTATEKALMGGLTDPEMVSIMIGDCRISMPGLHQLQTEKRSVKKSRGQKK